MENELLAYNLSNMSFVNDIKSICATMNNFWSQGRSCNHFFSKETFIYPLLIQVKALIEIKNVFFKRDRPRGQQKLQKVQHNISIKIFQVAKKDCVACTRTLSRYINAVSCKRTWLIAKTVISL